MSQSKWIIQIHFLHQAVSFPIWIIFRIKIQILFSRIMNKFSFRCLCSLHYSQNTINIWTRISLQQPLSQPNFGIFWPLFHLVHLYRWFWVSHIVGSKESNQFRNRFVELPPHFPFVSHSLSIYHSLILRTGLDQLTESSSH